jgi:16S rRNA (cytosine1402-N4)-methyltransferase
MATSPHRPLLCTEVLRCLQPAPGDVVVDATLGGGGHASALLRLMAPDGHLLAFDTDPQALDVTSPRLRAQAGTAVRRTTRHASFRDLHHTMQQCGVAQAQAILVDLGISQLHLDDQSRGFHFTGVGPLDMRLDPARGRTAAEWLASLDATTLTQLLEAHADEPHARRIADLLTSAPVTTTQALERRVRLGLEASGLALTRSDIRRSVRRTFQTLRIAVNDELTALEALLSQLPDCLAPEGRVVILTFHSGEERRVIKAFEEGLRRGVYERIARTPIRSLKAETRADRRAAACKMRWAIRA